MSQQRVMESGHQRRALPAQRNIPPPKIADHRNPRMGDELIIIANLQSMRRIAGRFMPYRLSMTTNGDNILRAANVVALATH
nr:Uncharacterised protein [Salmonella sp. NCTC 7297]